MKRILITTALLAGVFSYAGGFRVSLQGVKQLAMAHTSAHTEDASVAFFNPAGISFIPNKLSVAVGGFGAITEVEYQSLETLQSYKTENPLGTPLYAAIAYKVTNNVSVGLSVTTPFGSTVKWADDWTGREIVQKMELKSFYFQPMVSYKFNDWASIGVSYIYAKGMVDWDKAVTNLGGTFNINDEKATGSGFVCGLPDWWASCRYEMTCPNSVCTSASHTLIWKFVPLRTRWIFPRVGCSGKICRSSAPACS